MAWVAVVAVIVSISAVIILYSINENSLFGRAIGKRGLLFMVPRRSTKQHMTRPTHFWAWDLLETEQLHTSFFRLRHSLLLLRAFSFAVFCFTIIWQNTVRTPSGPTWLRNFSNWTFVLFGLHCLLGILLALKHSSQTGAQGGVLRAAQTGPGTSSWSLLDKWFLLQFVSTTSASLLLTAYYWLMIFKGNPSVDTLIVHGGSSILLLLETGSCRVPVVSYHALAPMAYGIGYEIFMWIYARASGIWVYEALDWSKPSSLISYVALPIGMVLGFMIMFLVAGLREFFLTGQCCCACQCCQQCCPASWCGDDEVDPETARQELEMGNATESKTNEYSPPEVPLTGRHEYL